MSERTTLTLLLLLSLVLNTIGIVQWNSGAPYDTAHKAIETIEETLQGNWGPFYEHYNGQPPLMNWLLAPIFLLVGVSAVTLHFIGILSGVLTTLLLYFTGKAFWSRLTGIYAALLGTTSHWYLLEMREGTHNILLVPLLLTTVYCLALIFRAKREGTRYIAAFFGGLAAGLMEYTYAAGFIFPPFFILLSLALAVFCHLRPSLRSLRLPLILLTTISLLTIVPMIEYTRENSNRVFARPGSEIGESSPKTLTLRFAKNFAPTLGAFVSFPFLPAFAGWAEENTTLNVIGLPIHFPAPFTSPLLSLLFAGSLIAIPVGWRQKRPRLTHLFLLLVFIVALIPNSLTVGAQPHYRRAVCAMVPLFLLGGWSAAAVHQKLSRRHVRNLAIWGIVVTVFLIWEPVFYFRYGVKSSWFDRRYFPEYDVIAPALFARVVAGQQVTVVANVSHAKSLQFYALASPQGHKAFSLFDLPQDDLIPSEVLDSSDVIVFIPFARTCDQLRFAGFSKPSLIYTKTDRAVGCIFDRPETLNSLKSTYTSLPASPPLLHAFLNKTSPFEPHKPFRGDIFRHKVGHP